MLSRFIIAFLPKNLACSQTSRQKHILSFSFCSFSLQQLYRWKLELEFRSHLTWDQSLVLSLASFVTLGLLMECSESWFLCVTETTQAASEDCGEGHLRGPEWGQHTASDFWWDFPAHLPSELQFLSPEYLLQSWSACVPVFEREHIIPGIIDSLI